MIHRYVIEGTKFSIVLSLELNCIVVKCSIFSVMHSHTSRTQNIVLSSHICQEYIKKNMKKVLMSNLLILCQFPSYLRYSRTFHNLLVNDLLFSEPCKL